MENGKRGVWLRVVNNRLPLLEVVPKSVSLNTPICVYAMFVTVDGFNPQASLIRSAAFSPIPYAGI